MGEKGKSSFTLPKEKVTIKFIKRNKGLAADVGYSHIISGGMI